MNDEESAERPTNLADLMAGLVPPPEPEPISLMPQTLGWPIALVLLLVLVAFLVHRIIQSRRAEAYRHAALVALDAAGTSPSEVALVLRQTALTAFPRAKVASLHGQEWLNFLAATGGQAGFQGPDGHSLITLPYSEAASLPEPTLDMIRNWIRHHDRAAAV